MGAKENLKPLKILVISLGFVLIGGTILLAGLVWKKVASESASTSAPCAGGRVDLSGRGSIVDSVISGNRVYVTMERADGTNEIVTLDLCSGDMLGSLKIQGDSGDSGKTI